MKSYRLDYTKRSKSDLLLIHRYISEDSIDQADKLVRKIVDSIASLKHFPYRQSVQSNRTNPVRQLPVGNYVVFFLILESDSLVRILSIRHGARRIPKSFR